MTNTIVHTEALPLPQATTRTEEQDLLDGLRLGDEAAYETLILLYEQPIYGLVYRLVEDPADSADIVQEVFLKVFRKVNTFRGACSLKTWIYRIAINEARNQRRWFSRHRQKEVALDAQPGETQGYVDWLTDATPTPFEVVMDRQTQHQLEAALKLVNPVFRPALVLREVEDLSYEEVAAILGVSLGTVKSRITRGRDALRKILQGTGLGPHELPAKHGFEECELA